MIKFVKIIIDKKNKQFQNIKYLEEIFYLFQKHAKYLHDDYFVNELDELLNLVERSGSYFWAILDKKSDKLAGFAFLENLVGNSKVLHSAEVTTCFKQEFWGSFTKIAARKFVRYCFKILELKKLKAVVFKNNLRVKSLLKIAGFKKEAILVGETLKNNKLQDVEIFSIIKKEVKNEI